MTQMNQMMRQLGLWAVAHNVKKPDSDESMRGLVQFFMAQGGVDWRQCCAAGKCRIRGCPLRVHLEQRNLAGWDEVVDQRPTMLYDDGGKTEIVTPGVRAPGDFEDYLEERADAMTEAGGDDLARDSIMQDNFRDKLREEAVFARQTPPSAIHSILGNSQTLGLIGTGEVLQGPIETARWTGETVDAMPVSVAFGMIQKNVPPNVAGCVTRPYGRVQFGTRNMLIVEVDIGWGTQLVVVGSQVIVEVAIDDTLANLTGAAPQTIQLVGMIGFNSISPRSSSLTRTKYFDAVNGVTQKVNLPAFAKTVYLVRNQQATDAYRIDFIDATNKIQYAFSLAAGSDMSALNSIPISGDIASVNLVTTAGGNATSQARLIFGLAL